jgi:hypothetical protein
MIKKGGVLTCPRQDQGYYLNRYGSHHLPLDHSAYEEVQYEAQVLDVPHSKIFDMPVKLGLEFVSIIGSHV